MSLLPGIEMPLAPEDLEPPEPQRPYLAAVANGLMRSFFGVNGDHAYFPSEVYVQACAEMRKIAEARGFPLPRDEALVREGVEHFLMWGRVIRPHG